MSSPPLSTSPNRDPRADGAVVRQVVAASSGGRHTPDSLVGAMTLKDIGIDSLKLIVMILELENKLRRKIFNAENLGRTRTLDDLLQVAVGQPAERES